MDFRQPFRGSATVSAGLVTAKELRGPRFRRLFQDVYVHADVAVDLALRSRAAFLLVRGRGVLCGYSAAELLGASCGPRTAPAEVLVPAARQAPQAGLRVSRGSLPRAEAQMIDGLAVTTPLRTAYDLARRTPLVEAVVAVDALSHVHGFDPAEVVRLGYRHLGARGSRQLPEVVRWTNRLAGSPMESRVRLAIAFDGLPVPVLQHPVGPYVLDLAYPALRLGIEYNGQEHLGQEQAQRDLVRESYLAAEGWREILRFRASDVLHRPQVVAGTVRNRLMLEARARDLPLHAFDRVIGAGAI